MTETLTGRLLIASPTIGDPNFERTVVLMLEHGDEGAVGVVLNRPTEIGLPDELADWHERLTAPAVVFQGGPVQPEALIALARAMPGGTLPDEANYVELAGGMGTVDLQADADTAADGLAAVRVFVGYAGWSPGQLESEIALDAWFVVDAAPDDAHTPDPGRLWSAVLARQSGKLAWYANYPDEPSVN